MTSVGYFGFESSVVSLVIDLLILFGVVLYASLVYWTYADARRRILDPMLIGCAAAASMFFPFVGTIVYMIVRPPEYLEDVHERELEVQAAEARLHDLNHSLCPHCDYPVERDFVRCPSCLRKLKERCVNCSRPLDRSWTICPYCETEVPSAKPARSAGRRSRSPVTEPALIANGRSSEQAPAPDLEAEPLTPARARAAKRSAARAAAQSPTETLGEADLSESRVTRAPRAHRPRST